MQDCAQICITSAHFMLRKSPLHQMTCRICSGICEMFAEDCTHLADDLRRLIKKQTSLAPATESSLPLQAGPAV